jgi:hypothetical protein
MKKLLFLLFPVFFLDTGDTFPTSGAIANRAGGTDNWTNPSNITADDGSVASLNTNPQSHYLIASGFGFSIPSGATINSVTVKVESSLTNVVDKEMHAQLQDNGGSLIGSSKFVLLGASTGLTIYTYAVDNWGATLTPAIVNDADFGVRFWFIAQAITTTDYVTISINYSNRRAVIIN